MSADPGPVDAGPPLVVLVGAPGSGKTTVGRLLAERIGAAFRDTDADVEQVVGKTVADIFIDEGEDYFRAQEREAVQHAVREHPGVLSLGGGAVLDPATRETLAPLFVVWLKVSASTAAGRVGLSAPRPLLLGNVRSKLVELMRRRAPYYEEVAELTVETDDREPGAVVDEIVGELARAGGPETAMVGHGE
ncbi:MAG: shikimate kinase [Candidatus Nanopelagicales bacterium]|nr:shikimate kinase [Candidatus Nanopelagicales bacterium]